ncbi:MAG: STAS-like domain-containing protein [Verrucomicrobia bacterium]|nr:STAS-like domain-containing protein [Verrucomicrobiota bacterium]
MKLELHLAEELGSHLADGAKAVAFRMVRIDPYVGMQADIVLDFTGVRHGNSSFVNGLLTGLLEEHGEALLDRMTFRGCNPVLRVLIEGAIALGIQKYDTRARA